MPRRESFDRFPQRGATSRHFAFFPSLHLNWRSAAVLFRFVCYNRVVCYSRERRRRPEAGCSFSKTGPSSVGLWRLGGADERRLLPSSLRVRARVFVCSKREIRVVVGGRAALFFQTSARADANVASWRTVVVCHVPDTKEYRRATGRLLPARRPEACTRATAARLTC
ncbi:hypothetical protein HPB51_018136 [Rhipicephalus microplus]|uniref:Uncharacterized protein n=1 Tax=Rhipicephalus microplus TaxID=6941 RepID=A0A9J6E3V1_RHIMP|nr:hypothetical protein HPB51_018136 [Rhipicephalus microplus]